MSEQNLLQFAERVGFVVTELNGFRSSIVNEEITAADFSHQNLAALLDQLTQVEGAVSRLADRFYSSSGSPS
jgi:hypothetical protein